ncbi:MAG: hypothetical protein EA396_10845 [Anaerolineaceae bacterium]|nr:MAG: hypothetical protein EA396_10845 [Anaerolineaceae bacterium]
MKMIMRFWMVFLIAGIIAPASVQAEQPPPPPDDTAFIEMLGRAPVSEGAVYYVHTAATYPEDDDALADASPLLPLPFMARWVSVPDDLSALGLIYEQMPDVMGFAYPALEHVLSFGQPPQVGVIWRGAFDIERVTAAHLARDFVSAEIDGINALCGFVGCAEQPAINTANALQGNLFDPALGRDLPFLIAPVNDEQTDLLSVHQVDLLPEVAAALNRASPSLLDDDRYRTLAIALTDGRHFEGTLVQAEFVPVTEAVNQSYNFRRAETIQQLPRNLRPFNPDERVPLWAQGYRDLPLYGDLIALADRQEGDERVLVIAVLYDFEGNAEFAAPVLRQRIETFANTGQTLSEVPLVEERNASVSHHSYADESGMGAAVITVRYTAPEDEADSLYRVFIRAIQNSLFYPLWDVTLP